MSKSVLLSLLVSLVLMGLPWPAAAFNPQPEPPASPVVGLAAGQTAQIHVSYVGATARDDNTPTPCDFRALFVDAAGEALFEVTGRVSPRQTFSVALPEVVGEELVRGERLLLLGFVELTSPRKRARVACAAVTKSTLEIFDTETGRANVVMGIVPSIHPPDPI